MVLEGTICTTGATLTSTLKVVTDSVLAVHVPSSSCAVALTV